MEEQRFKRSFAASAKEKRVKTNAAKVILCSEETTDSSSQQYSPLLKAQDEVKSKLDTLKAYKPENFQEVASETIAQIESKRNCLALNKLVENLNDRYQSAFDKQKQLLKHIKSLEQEITSITAETDHFRMESNERKAALKYDLKKMQRERDDAERGILQEIEYLSRVIEFYITLSGIVVTESNGLFKVSVKMHQEEFIFALKPVDKTFDYQLVSHTIPPTQVPPFLVSEINIDRVDAPLLLNKVFALLMNK